MIGCLKVETVHVQPGQDYHWRMQERGTRDAPPPQSNFFHFHAVFGKNLAKQEWIPLGCVLSAAVADGGAGVYPSMHWAGECVCPRGCLPRGGVCLGRCLPVGCLLRGCLLRGGVCGGSGLGVVSAQYMLGYTPHPLWTEWQMPVKT